MVTMPTYLYRETKTALPSVTKQLQKLEAVAAAFRAPHRFSVGELVTPREFTDLQGIGRPHRIVEIDMDARPVFVATTPQDGHRPQIRVAVCYDGAIEFQWFEAYQLEPWDTGMREPRVD